MSPSPISSTPKREMTWKELSLLLKSKNEEEDNFYAIASASLTPPPRRQVDTTTTSPNSSNEAVSEEHFTTPTFGRSTSSTSRREKLLKKSQLLKQRGGAFPSPKVLKMYESMQQKDKQRPKTPRCTPKASPRMRKYSSHDVKTPTSDPMSTGRAERLRKSQDALKMLDLISPDLQPKKKASNVAPDRTPSNKTNTRLFFPERTPPRASTGSHRKAEKRLARLSNARARLERK